MKFVGGNAIQRTPSADLIFRSFIAPLWILTQLEGISVTLSHFNKNARQYAANKNIELIDGDALINMMDSETT
ncbi:restriction endonuclease [Bacillus albus]|uniref:restriction endonuclease n=1 Tax=Bacillus sp. FSL R5-0677 TaxID=2921581 RepID=UPI00211E6AD6|nr:restriction endonuclease [Bacillus albus]